MPSSNKISPREYEHYIKKLIELQFDLEHAHLILFTRDYQNTIRQIEAMINHMTLRWGFTHIQIAKLVGLGGSELLNNVILYTNPLLSFGYTAEDIYKIAVTDNPALKFEFLIHNHFHLISLGLNFKNIPNVIFKDSFTPNIMADQTSRLDDTPSPYSHAIGDEERSASFFSHPLNFFDCPEKSDFSAFEPLDLFGN
jgi:hypothetical protein